MTSLTPPVNIDITYKDNVETVRMQGDLLLNTLGQEPLTHKHTHTPTF